MVTTKAVKSTALEHLRGNWPKACSVAMIPVFATIAVVLIGYLLTLPFGTVIADVISVIIFILLCAPLWMGALRVYWRLANGCDDDVAEAFYYFSGKKEYKRCFLFNLRVTAYWLKVELLVFFPCLLTYVFTNGDFYEWLGISMPLILLNLRYLIYVFYLLAFIVTIIHIVKLYLPAFLLVSDEEMPPVLCFKRGIEVGAYTKSRFSGFAIGFLGWIILSLLFIPLLFTVPYLLMSYVVACRYNVAYYNISGKAQEDAPMHEI